MSVTCLYFQSLYTLTYACPVIGYILKNMQSEEHAPYHHPSSHGRRRFGRNKGRVVTTAVLFVGLVIGVLAGRWSLAEVKQFVEEDPPTAPKDPYTTVLDEFEGMWVLSSILLSYYPALTLLVCPIQKSGFTSSDSGHVQLPHKSERKSDRNITLHGRVRRRGVRTRLLDIQNLHLRT